MRCVLTYYKNSNTGELIMKQHFPEIPLMSAHEFYYDKNKNSIDASDLTGFVEISEKKFNRESKRKVTS